MAWLTFGTATSPEPMSALDTQFNNVASGISIPCTALGTNAISLTPLSSFPSLTSYNELGGYRFAAVATSTGAVTLQYNGLGFLPAYKTDGITQCSIGDIVIGEQYIATFHQALNGGGGGFYMESPSISISVANPQFSPGGRLTLQSGVPVMFTNQLNQQTVYYAPYLHPFVPIYNGSGVQMYQFTSSSGDQVGLTLALAGSANWTANLNYDFFIALNGSTPVLGTVAWTNNTTRATTLSIFAGFLTNGGVITLRTGAATTQAVPVNQATFVGTMQTNASGQTTWQFGGSGSGGVAAFLNLANYYNSVEFITQVVDNGAAYTYSSATIRQARASTGNQINFVQSSSERMIHGSNFNQQLSTVAANAFIRFGLGVNTTTAFLSQGILDSGVGATTGYTALISGFSFTGYGFLAALEEGDGTNANNFNNGGIPLQLQAKIWL